jgi:hypothetical protein
MKVVLNDILTLSFAFHHETKRKRKLGTTVFVKKNGILIFQTRSHKDSRDRFLKEEGRKKALKKAFEKMKEPFLIPQTQEEKKANVQPVLHEALPLTKEQRSIIWSEYAIMTKKEWAHE